MTCCQIDYVCYIYLLQWNKSIWILSSWGDNVYGYDFNGEMWRKANHKMTGIGRFFGVQISQISESDQSFCDLVTPTLMPPCHLAFIVFVYHFDTYFFASSILSFYKHQVMSLI